MAEMKPYRDKLWAIVGPRGKVKPRLSTTRRVALSQYGLHYAKPQRVVVDGRHFKEIEATMTRKGWSVRPVWLTITARKA